MSLLDDIEPVQARTLPVILLLDTSGSMRQDDKIDVLNDSVAEMIKELASVDAGHGFITLTLIAFGGEAAGVIQKNVPVANTAFTPLKAGGKTPMGHAFTLARELIENRDEISSKAYRPTIALVSDGLPVPALAGELEALIESDRGSKSSRFALAVGADADRDLLARFTSGGDVREASEAAEIRNFLQWVTNTVTQVTLSIFDPDVKSQLVSEQSIARLQQDDAF
ncbi:VWA domain-containing protein [Rhodococcus sp. IEGM 1351]|uniref:vWA domain-containing protein n=1 Tax=Rhodococcus sp. IEGM 1351 TaxID=3047089 RepID=UPI0024B66233|nr:VWA domain-containing protein [Rhodococcus sp. IEGM 1351]MDI9941517.1 VWA domain-containing protein [Rhodococcus sp. IEGM 1351]